MELKALSNRNTLPLCLADPGHVAEVLGDSDNATREAAVAFFAAAGPAHCCKVCNFYTFYSQETTQAGNLRVEPGMKFPNPRS